VLAHFLCELANSRQLSALKFLQTGLKYKFRQTK
jgi:hypothetical protein